MATPLWALMREQAKMDRQQAALRKQIGEQTKQMEKFIAAIKKTCSAQKINPQDLAIALLNDLGVSLTDLLSDDMPVAPQAVSSSNTASSSAASAAARSAKTARGRPSKVAGSQKTPVTETKPAQKSSAKKAASKAAVAKKTTRARIDRPADKPEQEAAAQEDLPPTVEQVFHGADPKAESSKKESVTKGAAKPKHSEPQEELPPTMARTPMEYET